MTIENLIALLSNRVQFLQSQRPILVAVGDVAGILSLDEELAQTEATLNQLRTLGG